MTYREITINLIEEMMRMDVETLEEFSEEWTQALEKQGCKEQIKLLCRTIVETVIERKKQIRKEVLQHE